MVREIIKGFKEAEFPRVKRAINQVEAWSQGRDSQNSTPVFFPPEGEAFYNDSGEDILPYSIAVYDASHVRDSTYATIKVKKPSTTFKRQFLITPGRTIAAGAAGFFAVQNHYLVRYDSGTPAIGEGWGVRPGQWTASRGFPGMTVVGIVDATNKIALVSLDL